ncbi:MAG: deaminase [Candidatus Paceibacterota bacterium]
MFMLNAILAGVRSSCLVRQVGASLVKGKRIVASGYNGAPKNVITCLDKGECYYQRLAYDDSLKGHGDFTVLKEERKQFCSAIHAEQNALNQCLEHGVEPKGSTLFVTNDPCPGCTKNIIQAEVAKVVVWKDYLRNKLLTEDEYSVSRYWLAQAGVAVTKLDLSRERIQEIFSLALSVGDRTLYQFVGMLTPPQS